MWVYLLVETLTDSVLKALKNLEVFRDYTQRAAPAL